MYNSNHEFSGYLKGIKGNNKLDNKNYVKYIFL